MKIRSKILAVIALFAVSFLAVPTAEAAVSALTGDIGEGEGLSVVRPPEVLYVSVAGIENAIAGEQPLNPAKIRRPVATVAFAALWLVSSALVIGVLLANGARSMQVDGDYARLLEKSAQVSGSGTCRIV